jgi:hypothetical protein
LQASTYAAEMADGGRTAVTPPVRDGEPILTVIGARKLRELRPVITTGAEIMDQLFTGT